ncbi:MAG: ketoacyl-ACP synthase III [Bdellovibrionales bacterium]|nr:ketoacyl-ACP synthase III [Bdellovibrionales bacterium]
MTPTQLFRTRIAGIGSYLPEKTLTNKDLEKIVDTSDEWITERTGIRSRHVAADDQTTSDLAYVAATKALEMADVSAKDLDLIIFATVSPDQMMPSTACVLQEKLKANNCMAFDLTAACSGFIYSLAIADQFIKTGAYKNILLVGAEILTRFVNYQDRQTCILFGDGAGAVVVRRANDNEDSMIVSHHLHAEGAYGNLLSLPSSGAAMPPSHENIENNKHKVEMQGRELFKQAVRTMAGACVEAIESNKLHTDDIDWLIPHQANIRIIESVAKHAKFPMEKVIVEIENLGNTSAATIPIALDRSIRNGKIKRGQNILLAAFGGGLTSGSIYFKY